MIEDRPPTIDLQRPRAVGEILAAALSALGRYPVLFITLAAAVVIPYDLLVLATTKAAPLGQQSTRASTAFILVLISFALVGPLVSALDVHAVVRIGAGERPRLGAVARQGIVVLPVVAAAQIVAGLGIGLGLILLVIPGIILALRWAVVAQVAAVERTDWLGALRRSGQLVAGNYLHVFGVTVAVAIINLLITEAGAAVAGTSTHAPQVALGMAVETITRSFTALTSAFLYFDLVARGQVTLA